MKKIKINDKRARNIAIIVLIVIIVLAIIFVSGIFIIKYRVSKDVVTQITTEPKEIEWLNEEYEGIININDIIKENVNNQIKEVIETQVVELEYETQYQNNPSLPKGKVQVLQQGQDGKQELIIKKQYG